MNISAGKNLEDLKIASIEITFKMNISVCTPEHPAN